MEEYWRASGLEDDPFPATRAAWFSDDALKRRLDLLRYLIQSGDPLVLVKGAEGSGRSALLAQFIQGAGEPYRLCALTGEPGLNSARLLVELTRAFGDELAESDSEDLGRRLEAIQRGGGVALLLIDDAQALEAETLDTVLELYERMGEGGRLLRVVLVASSEEEGVLGGHPRFQRYRGTLNTLEVVPLTEPQVEAYLGWCIEGAGGARDALFSSAQVRSIQRESGGLPGAIEALARRMLGGGEAVGERGGGLMNLSKLRELDIKKVLTWSGVALLLLAILIFQGQINDMIQGDNTPPMFEEEEEEEPVAIMRRLGEMPQGRLPDQVVRQTPSAAGPFTPTPTPEPTPEAPAEQPPAGELRPLEGEPLREIGGGMAPTEGGVVGAEGEPMMVAEADVPADAMAADPLAGAPLSHRIPQLEEPTRFVPSETPGESMGEPMGEPVAETPEAPAAPAAPMTETPAAPLVESPAAAAPAEPGATPTPSAEAAAEPAEEKGVEEKGVEEKPAEKPMANVEEEAKAMAAPAAEMEKPAGPTLKGEAWLLEQPRGHIAVQVLGGPEREPLEAFAEKHGLTDEGALFRGDNKGRRWYVLLSGVYPSLSAARDALKALPARAPGYTPWTRSVASVQMEINKAK